MRMRVLYVFLLVCSAKAEQTPSPTAIFAGVLSNIVQIVDPIGEPPARTFTTRLEFSKTNGVPDRFARSALEVAVQAPDRLRVSGKIKDDVYSVGRNGPELWAYVPGKQFAVLGDPSQPRFLSSPHKKDASRLEPLRLPVHREQVAVLPFLMDVEARPFETLRGAECHVLRVRAKPEALKVLAIPAGSFTLWVRRADLLPARIAYAEGTIDCAVDILDARFAEPWAADKWQLPARPTDHVEKTAPSHLNRFFEVAFKKLGQTIPTLGPTNGQRRVVATEGKGRLELIEGTRVLFLAGTAEEMGRQHGVLLKKQVRSLVDQILYGVGVGSSFGKGKWFFREIEQAQSRLTPHMRPEYLQEMDSLAFAAGLDKEEVRLANYFPELFHCSGFALFGEATSGGRMYHGRILDYLRGVGLEQHAVVMVMKPQNGNGWVNVSYAGFVGSVTAMNEKHIAIGEMGGRGEGNWDGKPMAQLVREVMERASTIDEALAIMRKGPRTCEYYYVISDAKSRKAVGIAATPTKFETVWAGQSHPQLPHAIKDAVVLSADERYAKLVERVQEQHGKIDAERARDLMKRPVAMTSNIHSVLFAPDTLDFWVANADSRNVASDARWTHYNLKDLLGR